MNAKDQTSVVENVRQLTNKELVELVLNLKSRVEELENDRAAAPAKSVVEMTEDHARSVLNGEHANKKHKDAATALGLTYGQIYSCRLGYTFKSVHKELKDAGFKNPWIK